ncbi:phosphorylcholine transferase LicD [Arthrobacter sp. A2-55]|uniref:LicD family protein n=1 Tax=Arthrobacter sp. A2-55 TaxID=2897337 RepID=UPI0021CD6258|nr:LicD family protein [Arthrobacter sp. A2-55]MCU6479909.1 LicD family protein [Arthrobacter sp. A2-55]
MVLDEDQLEGLHLVQLTMADEVKRICERYQINYFLVAGSALGAVRHQGFIPWDDDIDFGMMRVDYDKFLFHAQNDLKPIFSIQTWNINSAFALPFAKLHRNDSKFVEPAVAEIGTHKGIYIDIFPFDAVPDQSFLRMLHMGQLELLRQVIMARAGYFQNSDAGFFSRLIRKLASRVSVFWSFQSMVGIHERVSRYFNGRVSKMVTAIGGSYGYRRETITRAWTEELCPANFENNVFPVFEDVDSYLRNLYGNYDILPPLEARYGRHRIIEFQLPSKP